MPLCSPSSKIKGCEGNCGLGGKYWQPTARFMTHVTCRLTAKNRDRHRFNTYTLGNRVWDTFTFFFFYWTMYLRKRFAASYIRFSVSNNRRLNIMSSSGSSKAKYCDVAVWQLCELLYTCYLLIYLLTTDDTNLTQLDREWTVVQPYTAARSTVEASRRRSHYRRGVSGWSRVRHDGDPPRLDDPNRWLAAVWQSRGAVQTIPADSSKRTDWRVSK